MKTYHEHIFIFPKPKVSFPFQCSCDPCKLHGFIGIRLLSSTSLNLEKHIWKWPSFYCVKTVDLPCIELVLLQQDPLHLHFSDIRIRQRQPQREHFHLFFPPVVSQGKAPTSWPDVAYGEWR